MLYVTLFISFHYIKQINETGSIMEGAVRDIFGIPQSTVRVSRGLSFQADSLHEIMFDLAALAHARKAAALKKR